MPWNCFHISNKKINTLVNYTKRQTSFDWGRVTHVCVGILAIIGSDNGLGLAIYRILIIRLLGTNFNEIKSQLIHFHSTKFIRKCRLENGGHFVSALMCKEWSSITYIAYYGHSKSGYSIYTGTSLCDHSVQRCLRLAPDTVLTTKWPW